MQVAIKYCGGCNCTYQRGHAIKQFKSLFPEHNYVVGNENLVYDIWLVICGCEKKCVETQKLVASVRTFVVDSEAEFQKLITVFKQFRNQDHQAAEKKLIKVNGEASYTKTFYWEDAHTFSRLTGDSSRLHLNYDFAQAHLLEGPTIHHLLVSSLMSTVMSTQFPGEGTLLMDEQVAYKQPVYSGDTITARVVLDNIKEENDGYIGTFSGQCLNQKQEVVAQGIYHQYMNKKFFELGE